MVDKFDIARRFYASLLKTQTLSQSEFSQYRIPMIERLCRHAALQTDFYPGRLKDLFEKGDPKSGRFLQENWRSVPILDRLEAQSNNAQLHARETPDWAGPSLFKLTSGSTGRPLFTRRSEIAEIAGIALFERLLEWHKFDRSGSFGWVRAPGDRDELTQVEGRGWNLTESESKRFEISKIASITQILDWLVSVCPCYLHASPSIVDGLVDEAMGTGRSISIKKILTTSEPPRESLRARVAETFGAALVDTYGTREVGQIAVTCPENESLMHISSECALIEILKDDGSCALPGEMGSVVATPFYSFGTPLVRYDLGDCAIVGEECPCCRTLPTISRVIGRKTALFLLPDGGKRAVTGLEMLRTHVPLLQLQVVQIDFGRIHVNYVPDRNGPNPDFDAATAFLRKRLKDDLEVNYIQTAAIQSGPGGKFEDFICKVRAHASDSSSHTT
jgi:phenylacetate-CoA ligase